MGNTKTETATLGSTTHSSTSRADYDFYATDPRALELLLELEPFDKLVWEPACGQGHLSKVLVKNGHVVFSTDLVDYGYGDGQLDFLAQTEE